MLAQAGVLLARLPRRGALGKSDAIDERQASDG
jgi:hypothetical protein